MSRIGFFFSLLYTTFVRTKSKRIGDWKYGSTRF